MLWDPSRLEVVLEMGLFHPPGRVGFWSVVCIGCEVGVSCPVFWAIQRCLLSEMVTPCPWMLATGGGGVLLALDGCPHGVVHLVRVVPGALSEAPWCSTQMLSTRPPKCEPCFPNPHHVVWTPVCNLQVPGRSPRPSRNSRGVGRPNSEGCWLIQKRHLVFPLVILLWSNFQCCWADGGSSVGPWWRGVARTQPRSRTWALAPGWR